MLSTSGCLPVAHEFACASETGWSGSEPVPVAPECPITAIASSSGVGAGGSVDREGEGEVEAASALGSRDVSPAQPASSPAVSSVAAAPATHRRRAVSRAPIPRR